MVLLLKMKDNTLIFNGFHIRTDRSVRAVIPEVLGALSPAVESYSWHGWDLLNRVACASCATQDPQNKTSCGNNTGMLKHEEIILKQLGETNLEKLDGHPRLGLYSLFSVMSSGATLLEG